VAAIPRGGVEVGYWVAQRLDADFSVIVVRKLPFPDNPEAGFGAIAEDGSRFLIEHGSAILDQRTIDAVIERQQREIQRRIRVLRQGRPPPEVKGRCVIVVDDGIAMGSTMQAAVQFCRSRHAASIVVAAPVAGPSAARQFADVADEVVILEKPRFFRAVAESYQNWYDVGDDEVISILQKQE
jgi:putative phosphoribosyl transferase